MHLFLLLSPSVCTVCIFIYFNYGEIPEIWEIWEKIPGRCEVAEVAAEFLLFLGK